MDRKEIECKSLDWIHLSQDRVHWRDLANTVIKFVLIKEGISWQTE